MNTEDEMEERQCVTFDTQMGPRAGWLVESRARVLVVELGEVRLVGPYRVPRLRATGRVIERRWDRDRVRVCPPGVTRVP
ncbi:MAG: hypothetical protein ABIJ95_09730 [Pseudomonadota bacterium]